MENKGKRHSNIDVIRTNISNGEQVLRGNRSLKNIRREINKASGPIAPVEGFGPVLRNNRVERVKLAAKRSVVVPNGSFNSNPAREELLQKYRLNKSNSPNLHEQSVTKGETETGSVGNRYSTIQFEDQGNEILNMQELGKSSTLNRLPNENRYDANRSPNRSTF